jgi:hypothetical protein
LIKKRKKEEKKDMHLDFDFQGWVIDDEAAAAA